jgi:hypothetical protein
VVEPGPTTLDLTGRFLGFGWDSTAQDGPTSDVYLEKLRASRIKRRLIARTGSGETSAGALLGPQIDGRYRLVWIRSGFGDSIRSQLERYTIQNGRRDSAPLQPVPGEPIVRTVIAGAVDDTTPLYLASGLLGDPGKPALLGEPCTAQSPCVVGDPGCSEAQPCELRTATGLRFKRPQRR